MCPDVNIRLEKSVVYYVAVDNCYYTLERLGFVPIASRQLLFYYVIGRPRLCYICNVSNFVSLLVQT